MCYICIIKVKYIMGMLKRLRPLKIGDTFGELKVISNIPRKKIKVSPITGKKTVRAEWQCECKCGNLVYRTGTNLRSGKNKTCSDCAYKSRPQSVRRFSDEERLYKLSIEGRCKRTDGRIVNELSLDQFKTLIGKNCYYCGKEPIFVDYIYKNKFAKNGDLKANGIDRIDSNKGYSLENCVPCCKICNSFKNNLTVEDFLNHARKIVDFNKKNDVD